MDSSSILLLKEALGGGRIVDLFKGRCCNASLEGRRRVPKATRHGLFFEPVDGRGQEAIRHLRRRFEAIGDGFCEVLLEVGEEHSAQSLGYKGHGIGVGVGIIYIYYLLVF
jgi:hypothetical protein